MATWQKFKNLVVSYRRQTVPLKREGDFSYIRTINVCPPWKDQNFSLLLAFFLDLLFSNLRLDSTSFRFDKLWRILSPETPDVYDSSDLWQGPQNFDLGIPIVFLTFLTYHEDRIIQNVRNSHVLITYICCKMEKNVHFEVQNFFCLKLPNSLEEWIKKNYILNFLHFKV